MRARVNQVALCLLAFALCVQGQASATVLYDLDFTAPEIGSYSTVFGSPTVVSSFDGLTDALLFHAVSSYDQIKLEVGAAAPGYQIGFDVVTHGLRNSQYLFTALLDTPEIRSVDFHGGLNSIYVFQPFSGSGTLQSLVDDAVYHLDLTIDLPANLWRISINDVPCFSSPINASDIGSIRFSLAPAILGAGDSPSTQVAIDNIRVDAIPEPSAYALTLSALVVLFGRRKPYPLPRA